MNPLPDAFRCILSQRKYSHTHTSSKGNGLDSCWSAYACLLNQATYRRKAHDLFKRVAGLFAPKQALRMMKRFFTCMVTLQGLHMLWSNSRCTPVNSKKVQPLTARQFELLTLCIKVRQVLVHSLLHVHILHCQVRNVAVAVGFSLLAQPEVQPPSQPKPGQRGSGSC